MTCCAFECLEPRRLFAAGQVDLAFGNQGVARPDLDFPDPLRFAQFAPGDKIVLVGSQNQTDTLIARLNADGTPDKTFGHNGTGLIAMPGAMGQGLPQALAIDPNDGRIAIVSTALFRGGQFIPEIDVFTPDGELDPSFNGDGRLRPVSEFDHSYLTDIGVATFDSSGRLIFSVVERDDNALVARQRIYRITRSGSLDSGFTAAEAIAPSPFAAQTDRTIQKVAASSDGGVLVGACSFAPISDGEVGTFTVFIQRAMSNGALDTGFGQAANAGTSILSSTSSDGSRTSENLIDFEFTSGNRLIALSDYQVNSATDPSSTVAGYAIYRLTPAGLIDTTFGAGGSVQGGFHIGTLREQAMDVSVDPFSGKILVSGEVAPLGDTLTRRPFIRRFNADGSLDGTFGKSGAWYGPAGVDYSNIQIRSDGKIVVSCFDNDDGSVQVIAVQGDPHVAPPGSAMFLSNSGLDIAGSSRNDVIDVTRRGGALRVTVNGKLTSYTYSLIKSITIHTAGGNDKVTVGDFILGMQIDAGDGADDISAGIYNDTVVSGRGNDTIRGNAGDDSINAGDGDDIIAAGDGNDSVVGGLGIDRVDAGDGNDLVYGGEPLLPNAAEGSDFLQGGAGNDTMYGQYGSDRLYGAAGDDRLIGGSGKDLLVDTEGTNVLIQ